MPAQYRGLEHQYPQASKRTAPSIDHARIGDDLQIPGLLRRFPLNLSLRVGISECSVSNANNRNLGFSYVVKQIH